MLLLVASAAVVATAIVLAGLLRHRGTVAFLLAAALLFHAIIVTTVGGAGLLLGNLSPDVLLVIAIVWLVGAVVVAWRLPTARAAWGTRSSRTLGTLRSVLFDPPVAAAALLVAGTLAWRIFLALRLPIVDYDGWSYHLVFVDVWVQHNALTLVPQRPWTAGYPADGELVATWFAAFTRSDALIGLSSVLPIPGAMAATIGLARIFGAAPRAALLAGLLFGMTPALVALAGSSYIDGASVEFVLATWWIGLRVIRGERNLSTVLLLGIAAGLAIGTKGTNLLLVPPILAGVGLVLLADLARRPTRAGSGRRFARLVLLGLPVVSLGLIWYAKNLAVHGNPLYPFAIGPFPGPNSAAAMWWSPPQLEHLGSLAQIVASWAADWHLTRYSYAVRPGGFGRAWLVILPLAVAGLILTILTIRRRSLVAVGLVVLPAAFTLLTTPNPWYARYTLFLVALGLALAAVVLARLGRRAWTVGGIALVALAAISLTFANIHPNIDVKAAFGSSTRISARRYLGYVLDPSAARRADVSLRAECARFDVIPPGARVVPGGFNLLHGVAGPNLDRILTDPVADAPDAPALARTMRSLNAEWIVTFTGGRPDRLAESAPGLFIGYGEICRGGRLWQLRAGS